MAALPRAALTIVSIRPIPPRRSTAAAAARLPLRRAPGCPSSCRLQALLGVVLNTDPLGRIALEMHDLLREVDGACGPHLKAVDPRVGLRGREQGHILAQTGDGAAGPWESDAIGV